MAQVHTLKTNYTIRDVETILGLSVEMTAYLCRDGIIVPSIRANPGRGSTRRFSFHDLLILRALQKLLDQGVVVRHLKSDLRRLKRDPRFRSLDETYRFLVTDGHNVLLKTPDHAIEEIRNPGQLAFHFIIDMRNVVSDVSARVAEFEGQRRAKFDHSASDQKSSARKL